MREHLLVVLCVRVVIRLAVCLRVWAVVVIFACVVMRLVIADAEDVLTVRLRQFIRVLAGAYVIALVLGWWQLVTTCSNADPFDLPGLTRLTILFGLTLRLMLSNNL